MVSTLFRDPQALSSDLASLGTLQPRAFGSLNRVETLDSASNYYIVFLTLGAHAHEGYSTYFVCVCVFVSRVKKTAYIRCCNVYMLPYAVIRYHTQQYLRDDTLVRKGVRMRMYAYVCVRNCIRYVRP